MKCKEIKNKFYNNLRVTLKNLTMEKTRKYIKIAIALLIILFSLNLSMNFIKFDNEKTNARIIVVLLSLILAERLINNSKK